MIPLQKILNQRQQLIRNMDLPLKSTFNQINRAKKNNLRIINQIQKQNKTLMAQINNTVNQVNKSGIKNTNIIKSLNNSTKNITPLTQQALDVKISILKSMTYQKIPQAYQWALYKQKEAEAESKEVDGIIDKNRIIPVKLEKPLAALHRSAGAIYYASLIKPEVTPTASIDFEPEIELKRTIKPDLTRESELEVIGKQPDIAKGTSTELSEELEIRGEDVSKPPAESLPSTAIKPVTERRAEKPEVIALPETLPLPKPKLIKNLNFDSIEKKAEQLSEEQIRPSEDISIDKLEVTAKPVEEELEEIYEPVRKKETISDIDEASIESKKLAVKPPTGAKEQMPEQILIRKPVPSAPVVPIMGALSLLAGSAAGTRTQVSTPKVSMKKETYAGMKEYTTPPKTQKIETFQKELDTKQAPKPKPYINWIPIAAAVGLIGGLAGTAQTVNIQAAKQSLVPSSVEEGIIPKPVQTRVATPDARSLKLAQTGMIKHKVKQFKVELPKPAYEPIPEQEPEEFQKTKRKMEKSEIPTMVKPKTPLTSVSTTGALGLLSYIAKRSVTPENIIYKPIPPARTTTEYGMSPEVISKRITAANANLPSPAGKAIDNLNLVATKSSSSLFIDKIQPVTPKKKETITPPTPIKARFESAKSMALKPKRSLLIDKGSKSALGLLSAMASTSTATGSKIYSKSPTAKISRDRSSITPIISSKKSIEIPTTPKYPELASGTLYRPATIEYKRPISFKPTIKKSEKYYDPSRIIPPTRAIFDESITSIDTEAFKYKPKYDLSVGGGEALGILSSIAASAYQVTPSEQIITTDTGLRIRKTVKEAGTLESKELVYGVHPDVARKAFETRKRTAEQLQFMKDKRIGESPTRFPSISEAMKLMLRQRPEQYIAKHISRDARERRAAEIRATDEAKRQLTPQELSLSKQVRPIAQRPSYREILEKAKQKMRAAQPELYQVKGPRSADFDRIPTGAPVKRDLERERMMELEDQIQLLKNKLDSSQGEALPSGRKLHEVVHDPNLQTQLKKMFYEAWLENMDKELKRYGD